MFVPDESVAPTAAAELVAEGIELVELYGGFGPTTAAAVSAAVGGRVPVGLVTFGMESLVAAAAAHEARRTGRPTHWGMLDDGTTGEQLVREHGPHRWTAVELSDPADAPRAAVELVRAGVELIEMPGGFETTTVAEVIAAVERKVPVGVISFGVEALAGPPPTPPASRSGTPAGVEPEGVARRSGLVGCARGPAGPARPRPAGDGVGLRRGRRNEAPPVRLVVELVIRPVPSPPAVGGSVAHSGSVALSHPSPSVGLRTPVASMG